MQIISLKQVRLFYRKRNTVGVRVAESGSAAGGQDIRNEKYLLSSLKIKLFESTCVCSSHLMQELSGREEQQWVDLQHFDVFYHRIRWQI